MAGHFAETAAATQKFTNGNALFFRYFAAIAVPRKISLLIHLRTGEDISKLSALTGAWYKGADLRFWKTEQNL